MDADYLHRVYLRMVTRYNIQGECHEFAGVRNNQGYGLISFNTAKNRRTTMAAHRFIYWQATKEDITDRVIMHLCDNPSCININHLQAGSYQDNTIDMIAKDRQNKDYRFTKRRRIRRLSDEQVYMIRAMQAPIATIAKAFSVSQSYVSKLKNGKAKQSI